MEGLRGTSAARSASFTVTVVCTLMTTLEPTPIPRLLTIAEVADVLAVSVPTVQRLIRGGELHALPVGGQVRISPAELAAYMSGGESEAA